MSHTKGEWQIDETKDSFGKNQIYIENQRHRCICTIHMSELKQSIANARLIAAAPALLAACEATISLLAEVAEMNIQPFPFSAVELNRKAKAAIAEAETK